jgi:hypothetical protein
MTFLLDSFARKNLYIKNSEREDSAQTRYTCTKLVHPIQGAHKSSHLLSRLLDLLQQVIVPDRALDGDDLGAEIDVVCDDA